MQNAFLLACALMLMGVILRSRIRVLAAIHLPAALIAGAIGLILLQTAWTWNGVGQSVPAWLLSINHCLTAAGVEWTSWRGPRFRWRRRWRGRR